MSGDTTLVMDTTDFAAAAGALADHLQVSAAAARGLTGLPDHQAIVSVLIVATGGSVVDAHLAAEIAGDVSPVPIVVHSGADLPTWVDPSTLVIVTGGHFGCADAIEALDQAIESGSTIVVVAEAGPLLDAGDDSVAARVTLDGDAAVRPLPGTIAVALLEVLGQCGLYPGATEWITAAISQVRARQHPNHPGAGDVPVLARRIGRTMPVIYGGDRLGRVAAAAWKATINQSAKIASFANTVPDLCYDELAGFGQNGDVTRQVFTLVLVRHDHEHPRTVERFAALPALLEEVYGNVLSVTAEGEGPLAQLLDLVTVGLQVSLEMARIGRVDPGPVPIVAELDAAVAEP